VTTKHAEKTRVDLWGQSAILNHKSSMGCYKWYQSRPLPVRCGSGADQAEAGGHVTSKADEGGEWSPVVHKA